MNEVSPLEFVVTFSLKNYQGKCQKAEFFKILWFALTIFFSFTAVTEGGQVFAWGDNDHGQQGNGTTAVNRKPALVHGLEGHRLSRVACGSSHSVCWTCQDSPSANCHEPVLFTESKDPLGASFVTNNTLTSNTNTDSNTASNVGPSTANLSNTLPR